MRQQGVTLIQMMFALATAGLLTQLGISAYSQMSEDLHRVSVARELAQALREARNQAALRHRAVLVLPHQGDWGQGWSTMLEHNGQVLRVYYPSRPVNIVASDSRVVRFSARGAPIGKGFGGTTLFICQAMAPLSLQQVVLSPSGRVRLRNEAHARCAGT